MNDPRANHIPGRILFTLVLLMGLANSSIAQPYYFECDCNADVDIRYFAVRHFHQIKGHKTFNAKRIKNQFCLTTEFTDTIEVIADGTNSSLIEVYSESQLCNKLPINAQIVDENIMVVDTAATDEYGSLELKAQYNGYRMFKFTHPTKRPPSGEVYGVYYIHFKNPDYNETWAVMAIKYYRPPVIMIHGLWSDATAFNSMFNYLYVSMEYDPSLLLSVDYKSTNAAPFSTNWQQVSNAVTEMITRSPACGKVDVVCHSMGGVLTRLYMRSPLFAQNKDIRRVITCNTPHAGSQMANWLLDPSQYGTIVATALGKAGMNCYGGAVSDLRVGQQTINQVAYGVINGDVKLHAIKTYESLFYNIFSSSVSYSGLASLYAAMALGGCGTLFLEDIFDTQIHDYIVAEESQVGGLGPYYVTTFDHQQHVGSVANSEVMARVKSMLTAPDDSPSLGTSYSGFTLNYNVNVPCLPFTSNDLEQRSMTSNVEITSPSTGDSIVGGSTLNVTYTAIDCDTVLCIIRVKTDTVLLLANSAAAGTMSIPLPEYLYGSKTLVLIGVGPDNRILASDSITLHFTTNATLDSISMSRPQLYLGLQDSTEFTVYGHYSDSVVRDISEDPLVFEFQQMNAALYGVYIVLDSFGLDSLVIKKGSIHSDTIPIYTVGDNFPVDCRIVSNTANGGPGSFREALDCSMDGDTIFFSSMVAGDTIVLDSQNLFIETSVVLYNDHLQPVVIRAASDVVLIILSETDVEMNHIQLQSDHPDDVCLMNFGNLIIENGDFYTSGTDKGVIQNLDQGVMEFRGENSVR